MAKQSLLTDDQKKIYKEQTGKDWLEPTEYTEAEQKADFKRQTGYELPDRDDDSGWNDLFAAAGFSAEEVRKIRTELEVADYYVQHPLTPEIIRRLKRTADTKPDSKKKSGVLISESDAVNRFMLAVDRNRDLDRTITDIAREMAGGKEREAQSLLRARRRVMNRRAADS